MISDVLMLIHKMSTCIHFNEIRSIYSIEILHFTEFYKYFCSCLSQQVLCCSVNFCIDFTSLNMRALLTTEVRLPNRPTPRESSIILLLLLITPSVRWVEFRAWIAAPKLSVIPWKGETRPVQTKVQGFKTANITDQDNKTHLEQKYSLKCFCFFWIKRNKSKKMSIKIYLA